MPRTYNDLKSVPPLKVVKTVEAIPIDAKLYDIKAASKELTEQYGDGFSRTSLYRLVDTDLTEGVHFVRVGKKKLLKFYLPAIQSWIVGG